MGGPVGAIIGAGMGHLADENRVTSGAGSGDFEDLGNLSVTEDDMGRLVRLELSSPPPAGGLCKISFLDEEGRAIGGRDFFRDEDGAFLTAGPVAGRVARIYLPFGAMEYGLKRELEMRITLLRRSRQDKSARVLGSSRGMVEVPPPPDWSMVQYLRPLLNLCMAVVNADREVLRPEVRKVKGYLTEAFELGPSHMNELKEAMKAAVTEDIHAEVTAALFRVPGMTPEDLLHLLADVSRCDGDVHPAEARVIHQAALAAGMAQKKWTASAQRHGFSSVAEPYAVLDLLPGATRQECKAAYRRKAAQYHPDRLADLGTDLQQLANRKMIELNAAWEVLRERKLV